MIIVHVIIYYRKQKMKTRNNKIILFYICKYIKIIYIIISYMDF